MITKKIFTYILLVIGLGLPLLGHGKDPFAGLPDPTRHKEPPPKKVVKKVERKSLILQSTLISDGYSHAVINGKAVAIGERIEGATLLSINPFNVELERRGHRITLKLLPTEVVRKKDHTISED